ncbi:MAG: type VI secretion system baseplate subunit TssF, partial [Pirellulales bacterium]
MTRNPLETLYENELTFIRRLGAEFARDRPKIADRLLLEHETGVSDDPHVERLIEAFAFLTARVRLKLEDEFPELTEALLGTLYPHYLAPIPSMAVVEFVVDPQRGKLPKGHTIARHSQLRSREVQGMPCRYRTAYPVTLWPIEVAMARYQTAPFGKDVVAPAGSSNAKAMIRLELKAAAGTNFAELELQRLRFFLSGEEPLVHRLYELIFNHVTQVVVRAGGAPTDPPPLVLGKECLAAVGFDRDEGLLPYSGRSFVGYRLLSEYFSFPSKFLFADVTGLEKLDRKRLGSRLEILLFLNRSVPNLEAQVQAETFRLGCTPAVNLFVQEADPIHLSHAKSEYLVIPDVRHHGAMEVYSVDSVESTNLDTHETIAYQPFYGRKHASPTSEQPAYWAMTRRPGVRKNDAGTDVYLSLVDLSFQPARPPAEVLTVSATCTNRDLPAQLRAAGGESWEFQLEGQAPYRRIVPVAGPTAPAGLPMEELRWRLISHLSLNHLSITEAADGAEALKDLLKVYDYTATRAVAGHIDGIVNVSSRRKVAPVTDRSGQGFCRGVEVTIEF